MKNSKKTIKKFKNDIKAREAEYQNDLKAIISGDYNSCLTSLDRLNDNDISQRQIKTIKEGAQKLSEDIKKMEELVKLF